MDFVVYCLWLLVMTLPAYQGRVFDDCRFLGRFYQRHPNIFALNSNQRSLTVRALYPMANQSSSSANQSLSMGIMYRFANTFLVPVPLLFECTQANEIYALNDCQLSVVDTRVRLIVSDSLLTSVSRDCWLRSGVVYSPVSLVGWHIGSHHVWIDAHHDRSPVLHGRCLISFARCLFPRIGCVPTELSIVREWNGLSLGHVSTSHWIWTNHRFVLSSAMLSSSIVSMFIGVQHLSMPVVGDRHR